ncbi:uncharacterized protein LOC112350281 [Selaginella moellendorffii]|uniref:uncharacterized protein LOC112350281 n=1 Tax=Selaginella moellendorffii TaxID=88036 RepID=UPI000D1C6B10|nr:uncharacterized protein LOC112350281 [Selaginella moellendorffii]|eukprot:XP_024541976.1 uncharacterized protein LOC112350281 [Selaginella moellendorffii]
MQEFAKPDSVTFSSVLSVCCHAGLVDKGRLVPAPIAKVIEFRRGSSAATLHLSHRKSSARVPVTLSSHKPMVILSSSNMVSGLAAKLTFSLSRTKTCGICFRRRRAVEASSRAVSSSGWSLLSAQLIWSLAASRAAKRSLSQDGASQTE